MARVHGLEHIHYLGSPDLSDDDSVRSHSQAVPHQIPLGDLSPSFDIGGPRFQTDDVFLLQLKFSRVLNRNDSLLRRDEPGEDVEQSRFPRACSP
jgi:hypothetical protein